MPPELPRFVALCNELAHAAPDALPDASAAPAAASTPPPVDDEAGSHPAALASSEPLQDVGMLDGDPPGGDGFADRPVPRR